MAKESADAGVAGLSEWEMVRGVMQGEKDVDLPEIPKEQFINLKAEEPTGWIESMPDPLGRKETKELFLVVSALYPCQRCWRSSVPM